MGGGDQEVAGGQQPGLVHPLTLRQVDSVSLLLDVPELRNIVFILVVQTEHVPRVLVQLRSALGEVDMFGLRGRIIAGVVDVVDQAVFQVG